MTITATPTNVGPPARATRRSLLMVPTGLFVWLATGLVGLWWMDLLGLNEGDVLLMDRSVAGWVAEVVLVVAALAAPALGVRFAALALRHGAAWVAWLGLVLNGALLVLVLYGFVDDIRMTYF
jgi:hypothetical protein